MALIWDFPLHVKINWTLISFPCFQISKPRIFSTFVWANHSLNIVVSIYWIKKIENIRLSVTNLWSVCFCSTWIPTPKPIKWHRKNFGVTQLVPQWCLFVYVSNPWIFIASSISCTLLLEKIPLPLSLTDRTALRPQFFPCVSKATLWVFVSPSPDPSKLACFSELTAFNELQIRT